MNTRDFNQIAGQAAKAYMAWDELRKAQVAELEKAEQDAEKAQAAKANAAGKALEKAKEAIKGRDKITWQDWCASEGIADTQGPLLDRNADIPTGHQLGLLLTHLRRWPASHYLEVSATLMILSGAFR